VRHALDGAVLLGGWVFGGSNPRALGRLAVPSGVLALLAAMAQLALNGPRTVFDLPHPAYGLAALAQAALPVLVIACCSSPAGCGRPPRRSAARSPPGHHPGRVPARPRV
jgi:hypothetical protein